MKNKVNFKYESSVKQWFTQNITKRKLLSSLDESVSYLQIIGFLLVLTGIGTFFYLAFGIGELEGKKAAISFFITMLGIAFVFPSMLEDQTGGVSTMRIVTFMMINVICLLLIKIGWDATSLNQIHLDQYWVGIIAFVFGAKATQSFFESRMAENTAQQLSTSPTTIPGTVLSNDGIVDQAIIKYKDQLKGNAKVTGVCKSYDNASGTPKAYMLINTSEELTPSMICPGGFKIMDGNQKEVDVPCKIIKSGTSIKPHGKAIPGASVSSNRTTLVGTLGCILKSVNPENENPGERFGLTCFHVVKNPDANDQNYIVSTDKVIVSHKAGEIGKVSWGLCMSSRDYALISLSDASSDNSTISYPSYQPKNLTNDDVRNFCKVKFKAQDENEFTGGYLIGIAEDERSIEYPNSIIKKFTGLYMFSGNSENHIPIAKDGDSGSLIIDSAGNAVAILVGSDLAYTYGLPLKPITDENKLILV